MCGGMDKLLLQASCKSAKDPFPTGDIDNPNKNAPIKGAFFALDNTIRYWKL